MNFDDDLMMKKWKKILPASKLDGKDSNVPKESTWPWLHNNVMLQSSVAASFLFL